MARCKHPKVNLLSKCYDLNIHSLEFRVRERCIWSYIIEMHSMQSFFKKLTTPIIKFYEKPNKNYGFRRQKREKYINAMANSP